MNIKKFFLADEIPFEELEKVGISKKMFLNLPKNALDNILTGRMSPMIKMNIDAGDKSVSLPAKLALERKTDGAVMLKIFPKMKAIINDLQLTKKEIEQLEKEGIVRKNMMEDGHKHTYFIQRDKETNTLTRARVDKVHIPESIGSAVLGENQKSKLKDGQPIELEINGSKITAGVNLTSPSGFSQIKGDINDWEQKEAIEWDRENPGVMGYWQTSENGWEYKEQEEKLSINTSQSAKDETQSSSKGIKR